MVYNSKIRVLLCSPYGVTVGGISRWTGHILEYYKKTDGNIQLTHYYHDSSGIYTNTPILIRLIIGILTYLPFIKKLHKVLKDEKYNVVHFTSSASLGLIRDIFALRIVKQKKVSSIIHFRFGRIPIIFQKKNWEYRLIKIVINLADYVIVIDKSSFDILVNLGYKKISYLPNPITPIVADIINNFPKITRDERKIIFVGHVVISKGVLELIDACKLIPNIKLKIIGYITQNMETIVKDRGGEGCDKWLEIAGEKEFELTIKEMLSAGVFVLPTYTEGFPNVILESMACGCPIVTTNVGAIPEMLDIKNGDKYGICVEPKNVEQLKNAIVKMLDNRKFALDCGSNAQFRVNELYSMPKIWKQLETIWYSQISK